MKILYLLMVASCLARAQYIGPFKILVPLKSGSIVVTMTPGLEEPYISRTTEFDYSIVEDGQGNKYFNFYAQTCDLPPPPIYDEDAQMPGGRGGLLGFLVAPPPRIEYANCTPLLQSAAEKLGPIAAKLTYFYSLKVDPPAMRVKNYGPYAPFIGLGIRGPAIPMPNATPEPLFTALSSATAAVDPQIIFLDGFSNDLVRFDLTTYAMTSQVAIASSSGPVAQRHAATGPENEVWVANYGLEVSAVDLGAQQVLATIPTPSIPVTSTPAGIVFTNDGAFALEAVRFSSSDSSGNNGALLVFDAVKQTVGSTLLLPDRPTALIMSPDGLTAYILDDVGKVTYYDFLSGTADLSVSTYTPGMNDGYPGAANNVFIHPDGTRLFWNVGVNLEVFDLTTRKVTSNFSSGLPSTSGVSIQMTQDGSEVVFGNGAGNNVILDTLFGNIITTFNTNGPALNFGGVPAN